MKQRPKRVVVDCVTIKCEMLMSASVGLVIMAATDTDSRQPFNLAQVCNLVNVGWLTYPTAVLSPCILTRHYSTINAIVVCNAFALSGKCGSKTPCTGYIGLYTYCRIHIILRKNEAKVRFGVPTPSCGIKCFPFCNRFKLSVIWHK